MALPRPRTVQHFPTRCGAMSGSALGPRWVQVDDAELVRRLQRVRARHEASAAVDLDAGRWKWECNKKGFSVYSRRRGLPRADSEPDSVRTSSNGSSNGDSKHTTTSSSNEHEDAWAWEVVATGTVAACMDKLATRFRSASESDLNAHMKALYRSQFIYGSLVHVVAFPDRVGRCAAAAARVDSDSNNSSSRSNMSHVVAAAAESAAQVTVKTCSFARPRSIPLLGARNQQWCLVEQFRRTSTGFAVEFSSVDVDEISLGKARPGCVDELQPVSGWLSVEQASPEQASAGQPLRVLFRARVEPRAARSRLARYSTPKATLARLVELGKGLSRLGDEAMGRPAAALSDKSHANTHCISCTARLRLASRLVGRQRRCQLCFYAACADCCRREQLMIYSRYTAALDVCHRCKESMQGGEYSHLQLVAAKRHGSHGSLSLVPPSDRGGGLASVDGRTLSAVNMY